MQEQPPGLDLGQTAALSSFGRAIHRPHPATPFSSSASLSWPLVRSLSSRSAFSGRVPRSSASSEPATAELSSITRHHNPRGRRDCRRHPRCLTFVQTLRKARRRNRKNRNHALFPDLRAQRAVALRHRAREARPRSPVPRLPIVHSPHMGAHLPRAARAIHTPTIDPRDTKGGDARAAHAAEGSHSRMRTFTVRAHVHVGMDGEPGRLQPSAERG
jgi:hypothetical protein